jgi:hypothetical protein
MNGCEIYVRRIEEFDTAVVFDFCVSGWVDTSRVIVVEIEVREVCR